MANNIGNRPTMGLPTTNYKNYSNSSNNNNQNNSYQNNSIHSNGQQNNHHQQPTQHQQITGTPLDAPADCTIACDKGHITAHKLILCDHSKYLQDILSKYPTAEHPIIILTELNIMDIKILVNYMYTGELVITSDSSPTSLLRAAQILKIDSLTADDQDDEDENDDVDDDLNPNHHATNNNNNNSHNNDTAADNLDHVTNSTSNINHNTNNHNHNNHVDIDEDDDEDEDIHQQPDSMMPLHHRADIYNQQHDDLDDEDDDDLMMDDEDDDDLDNIAGNNSINNNRLINSIKNIYSLNQFSPQHQQIQHQLLQHQQQQQQPLSSGSSLPGSKNTTTSSSSSSGGGSHNSSQLQQQQQQFVKLEFGSNPKHNNNHIGFSNNNTPNSLSHLDLQDLQDSKQLDNKNNKIRCHLCNIGLSDVKCLYRHVLTRHLPEKWGYKCEFCDREFSRDDHLMRHYTTKHKNMEFNREKIRETRRLNREMAKNFHDQISTA